MARVKGTTSLVLRYFDGGTRLSTSRRWRDGPQIVARDVGMAILAMRKGSRRIALLLDSPRMFARNIGIRRAVLTSAEAVLLESGIGRKIEMAAFLHFDSGQYSQAAILLPEKSDSRMLLRMTEAYFEWHSFSGFVLPRGSKWQPLDLLRLTSGPGWLAAILKVLRSGGLYFEDWDDGCGLKVWMMSAGQKQILAALQKRHAGSLVYVCQGRSESPQFPPVSNSSAQDRFRLIAGLKFPTCGSGSAAMAGGTVKIPARFLSLSR
jgi:hypothetical protein